MKKRKTMLFLLTIFVTISAFWTTVCGVATENENTSDGEISFYGEYKYPSEKSIDNSQPDENNINFEKNSMLVSKLPQTGNKNELFNDLIGVFMFLFSLLIVYVKKNYEKRERLHEPN